jgi:hypothetical protein
MRRSPQFIGQGFRGPQIVPPLYPPQAPQEHIRDVAQAGNRLFGPLVSPQVDEQQPVPVPGMGGAPSQVLPVAVGPSIGLQQHDFPSTDRLYAVLGRGHTYNVNGLQLSFVYQIIQLVQRSPDRIFQRRWLPGQRTIGPNQISTWYAESHTTILAPGRTVLTDGNYEAFFIGNILSAARLQRLLAGYSSQWPVAQGDISFERLSCTFVRTILNRLRRLNDHTLILDDMGQETGFLQSAQQILDRIEDIERHGRLDEPESIFAQFIRTSRAQIPLLSNPITVD